MPNHAPGLLLRAVGGGAICIVVVAVGWRMTRESFHEEPIAHEIEQRTEPAAVRPHVSQRSRSRLVATGESAERASNQLAASRFDAAAIQTMLSRIELDANGMPVVDERALDVLRAGFATLGGTDLSEAQLNELQEIVAAALPGAAGEEAAKLVGDYYRYDVARRALEAAAAPAENASALRARYEQLVALRQQHFGSEAAAKLFGKEQELARFTLESMRIQEQAALSQSDKDRLQASLREQLPPGVLPDRPSVVELEWQQRFAQFARERRLILDAGLAERDQQEQIERLLTTSFRPHELQRARRYVTREVPKID